jgi:hypothetical protein
VQVADIRELTLPNFLWLLRRIEMAKAPKNVVVEEEDEEEEEVVAKPKAKANGKAKAAVKNTKIIARAEPDDDDDDDEPVAAKPKAKAKAAVATKPAKKSTRADSEPYAPNKNSMRDFIMRAMKKGGTSEVIKKRAARFAEKAGVDGLDDPKAYKNFDVSYFAKFLKTKGMDVEIDEEADTYILSV